MSRFITISDEDLKSLDIGKDAKNTKRTIKRSVSLFKQFLQENGEGDEFEVLSKQELNTQLRSFFASVRKMNGDEMKKSSLHALRYGLARHLKDCRDIDINNDPVFSSCKTTFKGKVADLKKKGKGGVNHKVEISKEDLFKLMDPSNLAVNVKTPFGLQKKVWFDLMYYLCRRGQENLREMNRETFDVQQDSSGRRYVYQVLDEADKNHGADASPDDTVGEAKMYERRGDPMCPVINFELYVSKLNPNLNALWQRPLETFSETSSVWYASVPVGKNSLGNWMTEISRIGGLSKRYTNHCIRATATGLLDRAGHEARHIMRVTGHRSESSIRSYSRRLTEEKQRDMSDTLASAMVQSESNKPSHKKVKEAASRSTANVNDCLVEISESDILEVFRDDNDFLEDNQIENIPPLSNNEIPTVNMTFPHQDFQQQTSTLQCNNQMNCWNSQQIISPLQQSRPVFNINPTLQNCNVNFYFKEQ